MERFVAAATAAGEGTRRGGAIAALRELLNSVEADFRGAMDDDFNTPTAIAVLFNLAREANRVMALPAPPDQATLQAISDAGAAHPAPGAGAGHRAAPRKPAAAEDTLSPQLMQLLIELRAEARKEKNFALSDAIRNRLNDIGVLLEDTAQGTSWRLK